MVRFSDWSNTCLYIFFWFCSGDSQTGGDWRIATPFWSKAYESTFCWVFGILNYKIVFIWRFFIWASFLEITIKEGGYISRKKFPKNWVPGAISGIPLSSSGPFRRSSADFVENKCIRTSQQQGLAILSVQTACFSHVTWNLLPNEWRERYCCCPVFPVFCICCCWKFTFKCWYSITVSFVSVAVRIRRFLSA